MCSQKSLLREVIKHMTDAAVKVRGQFDTAVRRSSDLGLSGDLSSEDIDKFRNAFQAPKDAVKNRIERFQKETRLRFIRADRADMERLVNSYFKPLPPFESSGDKKNEFPNAIALLSLEKWAEENRKKNTSNFG